MIDRILIQNFPVVIRFTSHILNRRIFNIIHILHKTKVFYIQFPVSTQNAFKSTMSHANHLYKTNYVISYFEKTFKHQKMS